ncbi:hypothetical protein [Aureliella helgolandensis]|uniref:Uncharacterized protein n=1 Tax=Aureliella helgolandensis TaxID=2527968 RepID=A0A518G4T7_9BACT|nr:hypothetical protein [Aureliella helgolandensis]QDV23560.1 hypothetical protein Q31a_18620 [Aureliella helgolandensis]
MTRNERGRQERPLIDLAEGRDQDLRSDLYLAFKRCAGWRKPNSTNLHVRELLFWIMALDRAGQGVQKSYDEIADRLELASGRSARRVIDRAAKEFRLLVVTESRYERGGQNPNRYSINWLRVRALRDGVEDGNPWAEQRTAQQHREVPAPQEPGDRRGHPGDRSGHAGDPSGHPYKEHSRTITRSINTHPHSPLAPTSTDDSTSVRRPPLTEGEVVSVFLNLGVLRAATLVAQALGRGCDTRSLKAIARWYERSQRRHPTRWRKPSSVLMIRLTAAWPTVPAWKCWTPGEPPRRHSAIDRDDFQQRKVRARQDALSGPSMSELLAIGRQKQQENPDE